MTILDDLEALMAARGLDPHPDMDYVGHSYGKSGTYSSTPIITWNRLLHRRLGWGTETNHGNLGDNDAVSDGTAEVLAAIATEGGTGLYTGAPIVTMFTGVGIDALKNDANYAAMGGDAAVEANITAQFDALDQAGAQLIICAKECKLGTNSYTTNATTWPGASAAFDDAVAAYTGTAKLIVFDLADWKDTVAEADVVGDHLHPKQSVQRAWFHLALDAIRAAGFYSITA